MLSRMCRFSMLAIILLIACAAIASCGLPAPLMEVHWPFCLWAVELDQPFVISPNHFEIINDLTPTFSWYYPGDCPPRNYHIEVSNLRSRGDCYGGGWRGDGWLVISETIGASTEWSPAIPLEPLTLYHWRVAGASNDDVLGDYSRVACFFTGPTCDLASLVAPELVSPEDGVILPVDNIALYWEYSGECLPERYLTELSDDPSFAGPNLMDEIIEPEAPFTFTFTPILEDCTEYFWRVSARVGSILGPPSVTFTFTTDFEGTCFDTSKSSACDFDCDCEPDQGENEYNCPKDCPKHCGNGACDCGETSTNCREDCGSDDDNQTSCECGNGKCELNCGETPNTCSSDCP